MIDSFIQKLLDGQYLENNEVKMICEIVNKYVFI